MTIEELEQKLNNWRNNKKSVREKIPEQYWEEAVKLSKFQSLPTVAKHLGLNCNDLKKRMGVVSSCQNSKITFKKINLPAMTPVFELTTNAGVCLKVYQ